MIYPARGFLGPSIAPCPRNPHGLHAITVGLPSATLSQSKRSSRGSNHCIASVIDNFALLFLSAEGGHNFGAEQFDGVHHLFMFETTELEHADEAVGLGRRNHRASFLDHRLGTADEGRAPFIQTFDC
jgi:hypothetical protein